MLDFIKVIIISDNKWVNVKVLAVRAELNSVCGLVKIERNMNRLIFEYLLYFTCRCNILYADRYLARSQLLADLIILA